MCRSGLPARRGPVNVRCVVMCGGGLREIGRSVSRADHRGRAVDACLSAGSGAREFRCSVWGCRIVLCACSDRNRGRPRDPDHWQLGAPLRASGARTRRVWRRSEHGVSGLPYAFLRTGAVAWLSRSSEGRLGTSAARSAGCELPLTRSRPSGWSRRGTSPASCPRRPGTRSRHRDRPSTIG
jgi:hypothetical protein